MYLSSYISKANTILASFLSTHILRVWDPVFRQNCHVIRERLQDRLANRFRRLLDKSSVLTCGHTKCRVYRVVSENLAGMGIEDKANDRSVPDSRSSVAQILTGLLKPQEQNDSFMVIMGNSLCIIINSRFLFNFFLHVILFGHIYCGISILFPMFSYPRFALCRKLFSTTFYRKSFIEKWNDEEYVWVVYLRKISKKIVK